MRTDVVRRSGTDIWERDKGKGGKMALPQPEQVQVLGGARDAQLKLSLALITDTKNAPNVTSTQQQSFSPWVVQVYLTSAECTPSPIIQVHCGPQNPLRKTWNWGEASFRLLTTGCPRTAQV